MSASSREVSSILLPVTEQTLPEGLLCGWGREPSAAGCERTDTATALWAPGLTATRLCQPLSPHWAGPVGDPMSPSPRSHSKSLQSWGPGPALVCHQTGAPTMGLSWQPGHALTSLCPARASPGAPGQVGPAQAARYMILCFTGRGGFLTCLSVVHQHVGCEVLRVRNLTFEENACFSLREKN